MRLVMAEFVVPFKSSGQHFGHLTFFCLTRLSMHVEDFCSRQLQMHLKVTFIPNESLLQEQGADSQGQWWVSRYCVHDEHIMFNWLVHRACRPRTEVESQQWKAEREEAKQTSRRQTVGSKHTLEPQQNVDPNGGRPDQNLILGLQAASTATYICDVHSGSISRVFMSSNNRVGPQ